MKQGTRSTMWVFFVAVAFVAGVLLYFSGRDVIAKSENYPVLIENLPMRILVQTDKKRVFCSGSAIDDDTVATAAHCLKDAESIYVLQNGQEFRVLAWRRSGEYKQGVVQGDVAFLDVEGVLSEENHSTVGFGEYDLRAWVLLDRGTTVRGCKITEKLTLHEGHYHTRCPLGKGASGAGVWLYDINGVWRLVGVVSQYDGGIVSIADVEND